MLNSNPFGLPERRYLAGAAVEMALPVAVQAPGQSLNITAVTSDQGLQIAFLGIEQALPDIQQIADFTVQAFEQLRCATPSGREAPERPA